MTVITARPATVIAPRSERPLDGADAPSLNGALPGRSTFDPRTRTTAPLAVGQAVWVRHAARLRQGWVVGAPAPTGNPLATNSGRVLAAEVEYVADRTGQVLVHRFPVSVLRLRDVT